MKKTTRIALLLLLGAFTFAACDNDESKKERFYGYTTQDILGTYSFSNSPDAFQYITHNDTISLVCKDAEIAITETSNGTIRFHLDCPNENYNNQFVGKAPATPNDFLIFIKGSTQHNSHTTYSDTYTSQQLQADVYKTEEGKIRLIGHSQTIRYINTYEFIYNLNNQIEDTIVSTKTLNTLSYFFDVVKVETGNTTE